MNAFVALSAVDPAIRAAAARCEMLDGFSDAETAVNCFLIKHKVPIKDAMPTAQLVALASKVAPNASLSKTHHSIIAGALADLVSLLPVRADIVHSRMHVIEVNRETRLLFINPRQASEQAPVGRVIAISAIEHLAAQAKSIAAKISKPPPAANPPSQPRPAPAVTNDP